MAAPAVATQQSVFAAADRLLSETGQIPTLQAVREAVGGGSYKTLGDLMRLWKTQRQARPTKSETLPITLQDRVVSLAGEFWDIASELAQQRLDAERQALITAKDEAIREAAEAYKAADDAQRKLELADMELAETHSRLDAAATELMAMRTQLNQALAELATERQMRIDAIAVTAAANARAESADAERQRLSELMQALTTKPTPAPRKPKKSTP